MQISFEGQQALVTGAGKGIGRCICVELLKSGAKVVALSRTKSDLEKLKSEYPAITTVHCDLADWDATAAAVTSAGPIDLLVNNAAVAVCEPLLEAKPEDFDKMMNVNVKAVLHVTQMVAKSMVERGVKGSIVNISSQASQAALRDHVMYSATKGALDSATRVMALELGAKGIRVNAVNPTIIMTDMSMVGWSDETKAAWMKERIPLGRFGEAAEVAYPVLFLLSDKASMINGVTLPIDGGFLAC